MKHIFILLFLSIALSGCSNKGVNLANYAPIEEFTAMAKTIVYKLKMS
jgi:hypothetical protein